MCMQLLLCNLVGYVRIILALISFYFMPSNHVIATWAYIFSSLLDAVDGYAARLLNQGISWLMNFNTTHVIVGYIVSYFE